MSSRYFERVAELHKMVTEATDDNPVGISIEIASNQIWEEEEEREQQQQQEQDTEE